MNTVDQPKSGAFLGLMPVPGAQGAGAGAVGQGDVSLIDSIDIVKQKEREKILHFFEKARSNLKIYLNEKARLPPYKGWTDFDKAKVAIYKGNIADLEACKDHKAFLTKAVALFGSVIHFSHLKNDKEVALAAVKDDPRALEFVGDKLKADPEVVANALKKDHRAIIFAEPKFADSIFRELIKSLKIKSESAFKAFKDHTFSRYHFKYEIENESDSLKLECRALFESMINKPIKS